MTVDLKTADLINLVKSTEICREIVDDPFLSFYITFSPTVSTNTWDLKRLEGLSDQTLFEIYKRSKVLNY